MTDKINDGGPAFPFAADYGHPAACGGMSLRDWLAGHAMPTFIAAAIDDELQKEEGETNEQVIVRFSYMMADAMLAARAKGGAQ